MCCQLCAKRGTAAPVVPGEGWEGVLIWNFFHLNLFSHLTGAACWLHCSKCSVCVAWVLPVLQLRWLAKHSLLSAPNGCISSLQNTWLRKAERAKVQRTSNAACAVSLVPVIQIAKMWSCCKHSDSFSFVPSRCCSQCLPALTIPSSCRGEQGAVVMAIYVLSSEEQNWLDFLGTCSIIAVDTNCATEAAAVLPP